MTTPFVQNLPPAVREPIEQFARHVAQLAGSLLSGFAVYGVATTSAFDPARHRVRSALVLERFDLPFMRQLARFGSRYGRLHLAAPVIMTPRYIHDSCDTFALELLEIQQQHQAILGHDHFVDLPLEKTHLRLQCERELKMFHVGMHQGLLASLGDDGRLADLTNDVADGVLRVLRGLLWLQGQPAADGAGLVAQVQRQLGRDLPGLEAVLTATDPLGWPQFQQLYADIETLEQSIHGR